MTLLAVAAGLSAGILSGGRVRAIAGVRIRADIVLVLILCIQIVLPPLASATSAGPIAYWVWLATFPVLATVCGANWRQPGMLLAASGLVLNAVVIVLNHGMPVSHEAAAMMGGSSSASLVIGANDFVHLLLQPSGHLLLLSDVLPFSMPLFKSVWSCGDVVLGSGVAATLASGMLGSARL